MLSTLVGPADDDPARSAVLDRIAALAQQVRRAPRDALASRVVHTVGDPCECTAGCPECVHHCLGGHALQPDDHLCPELHRWTSAAR